MTPGPISEEILKVAPQELEAEEALIASLISSSTISGWRTCVEPVLELLQPQDCYRTSNRRILQAIRALAIRGEPPEGLLIINEMGKNAGHETKDRILDLADMGVGPLAALSYARIIKTAADRRGLIERLSQGVEALHGGRPTTEVAAALRVALNGQDGVEDTTTHELFFAIQELEALGHEDTDWILRDFLAPGEVTGIVGREKEGKTTFLYAMLAAIEKGQMFMGRTTQKTRAVIASEEPAQIVLEKARRFGIREARILPRHTMHRLQGFPGRLRACVQEANKHNAGILMLDSFAKVAGLTGEQENQAGTIQEAFDQIHEIVPEDIATALVHHASKSEKTGTHITRGSTAWAGAVDTFIAFTKPQRSSAVRRLEWTGRHAEYPQPALIELKRDQYLITNLDPQDAPRIKDAAEKIAHLLGPQADGMTRTDLIRSSGIPDRTLREALDFLQAYQRVTASGAGKRGSPRIYTLAKDKINA